MTREEMKALSDFAVLHDEDFIIAQKERVNEIAKHILDNDLTPRTSHHFLISEYLHREDSTFFAYFNDYQLAVFKKISYLLETEYTKYPNRYHSVFASNEYED